MDWVTRLKPVTARIGPFLGHFTRSMTLGVRVLARDVEGRVLLVRHTYLPGWYLPGGGVDPGEVLHAAAQRECLEETGFRLRDRPVLFGMYLNRKVSSRDHVALFTAAGLVAPGQPRAPDHEIAEIGLFAVEDLPTDLSPATARRLAEVLRGEPPSDEW